MTALPMSYCHHRLTWERGCPARMQASCLRSLIRRQHPEASGYVYEACLRGRLWRRRRPTPSRRLRRRD